MSSIRTGAAAEVWQGLVLDACRRSGQALDETCEAYLVFALLRHQRDPQLLAYTQALEWLNAQAQVGSARIDALQDVGDRCLLIAGLFPGLAQRRRVSVDYFIELGRGAYRDVAEGGRSATAALFSRLASTYRELVQVLRAVREVPAWESHAASLALAPAPAGGTRIH